MKEAVVLIVLIPVALLAARRIGDTVPVLLFFAVVAFMIFAAPRVPGSPVACLAPIGHGHCQGSGAPGWVLVPALAVAVAYKALRGDGRGFNGSWGPLRRLLGRR